MLFERIARGPGQPAGEGLRVKVEFINPFLESIDSVFDMMLNTTIERQGLRIGGDDVLRDDHSITSIIGMSGRATGSVALNFPRRTAIELACRFLGCELTDVDDNVTDALAELANIVAGAAKSKFNLDPPPQLSLPTVVVGSGYTMSRPANVPWVEVPFTSDAGNFSMCVSFEQH